MRLALREVWPVLREQQRAFQALQVLKQAQQALLVLAVFAH
jgi:hypothetical protein